MGIIFSAFRGIFNYVYPTKTESTEMKGSVTNAPQEQKWPNAPLVEIMAIGVSDIKRIREHVGGFNTSLIDMFIKENPGVYRLCTLRYADESEMDNMFTQLKARIGNVYDRVCVAERAGHRSHSSTNFIIPENKLDDVLKVFDELHFNYKFF